MKIKGFKIRKDSRGLDEHGWFGHTDEKDIRTINGIKTYCGYKQLPTNERTEILMMHLKNMLKVMRPFNKEQLLFID